MTVVDGGASPAAPPPRLFRMATANSLATAAVLSACAGYLDGFTFVGHGHVFASAMTGNMVLLGIHIATDGDVTEYLLPIVAFVIGVVLAHTLLRERLRRRLNYTPQLVTLAVEITVLTGLALLPHHLNDRALVAAITLSTSMQNTTFRNIGTRTYNSIIMTGNLQAFSNALAAGLAPFTPARLAEVRDLGAVLASFVGGAALGAFLALKLGDHALLVPACALAVGSALLFLSTPR